MPMIFRTHDYEEHTSAAAPIDMAARDPAVGDDLPPSKTFQEEGAKPLQMIQEEAFSKKRVGPKRKPEKSRIIRVRKSDEEDNLKCSYCLSEFLSYEDLQRHEQFCRRSPMSVSPQESSESHSEMLAGYRPAPASSPPKSMSPENVNERPSSKEGAGGGCAQVLKMLEEAVPHMNGSHQMAIEMILNAQMSLSRMALNSKENDSLTDGLPLHPQQLLQLQLIQLLQAQLSMNNNNNNKQSSESDRHLISREKYTEEQETQRRMSSKSPVESHLPSRDVSMSPTRDSSEEYRFADTANASLVSEEEPPEKTKSSNISSLVIQHSDSPPPSGLNTLEMLQKTADEVLNNATKGLLASRLIDSCTESDSKDPEARHRCRYCAKIFNSDSALQIHIRSHTGERPFKCNICGNRFTTKGNLKVHFQRHSDRFPHIKMNGHPVPENLDKFYPPLLQQLGELGENSPQIDGSSTAQPTPPPTSSHAPHVSFPLSPTSSMSQALKNLESQAPLNLKNLEATLFRPPLDSLAKSIGKEKEGRFFDLRLFPQVLADHMKEREARATPLELDKASSEEPEKRPGENSSELAYNSIKKEKMDEDEPDYNKKEVSSKAKSKSYQNHTIDSLLLSSGSNMSDESLNDARTIYKNMKGNFRARNEESLYENSKHNQSSPKQGGQISDSSYDDQSDNHGKGDDHENTANKDDVEQYLSDGSSDQKEDSPNSKSSSTPTTSPIEFSHIPFLGMPIPPNLPLFQGLSGPFPNPPAMTGGNFMPHTPVDPARNPSLYTNLLPRPGSTDNSWEALIEVDKTDENVKVNQLVGKSRATEPNQCAICQRVLSCKSALHMHYRTHTGERPFKCRICGRAFTTKGNLKTHMSVHRAKPPMRMFHQCSVCHKKFSNGLILQQHIKLHTGEPTDLTPEQISVAEIRDFPGDVPFPMRYPSFQPNGLPSPIPPRNPFPPMPLSFPFYMPPRSNKKDELGEGKFGSPFSSSPRSSSASSAEQQSAEDLSMKAREEDNGNDMGSRSITSPTPSDFSDIEEKSQGLLRSVPTSLSELQFGGSENPIFPPAPPLLPLPPMSSPETSKTMFPLYPPLGIFSPIRAGLDPLQAMHNCLPPMPEHSGNTTCKICFKIFACQSALEIHYRSHTKERPFKCTICDRGFSTKGNMKQHMATHKSSDFPPDSKGRRSPASPYSASSEDKGDTQPILDASATGGDDLQQPHPPPAGTAPLSADEDKCDVPGKRERDSEREGGISLPEPKRSLGSGEGSDVADEGQMRRASEGQRGHPLRSFQSPPLVSTSPSMVLPLPPSLSIPASISHLPYPGRPSPLPLSFPFPLSAPKGGGALNL